MQHRINESTRAVLIEVGKHARDFRIHQGLSLADMAEFSGVSLSNIAKFERGESASINVLIAYIMRGMSAGYIQEVCQNVCLR